MYIRQTRCGEMKVSIAHLGKFVHDKVDNFVTATEMMMERYGHTVFEPAQSDRLFKSDQFWT